MFRPQNPLRPGDHITLFKPDGSSVLQRRCILPPEGALPFRSDAAVWHVRYPCEGSGSAGGVEDGPLIRVFKADGSVRAELKLHPNGGADWPDFTLPAGTLDTEKIQLFAESASGDRDWVLRAATSAPAAAPTSPTPAIPAPAVPLAAQCPAPFVVKAPPDGGKAVKVTVGCIPANAQTDLALFINNEQVTDLFWSLVSTQPLTYEGKLTRKFAAADRLRVAQSGVTSQTLIVDTPPGAPATVLQVIEGTTAITGYDTNLDKVRVQVKQDDRIVEQTDAAVDKATGKFTASLSAPLGQDQTVAVTGLAGTAESESQEYVVNPAMLDWGRVRAYFTVGMVLSSGASGSDGTRGSAAFSQTAANPFISFNVDKNWYSHQRAHINTYFDARLTSIASASSSTLSSTPSTFLQTKQAGSLQGGFYAPFSVTRWRYANADNVLFLAPLVKAGFYTVNDAKIAGVEDANPGSFYKFYGYGVRVGHMREFRTWQGDTDRHRASDQLSYIDFLAGRWGNFDYARPLMKDTNGACNIDYHDSEPTHSPCAVIRQRQWRLGFEGILKVPYTPFILGVSANIAAQHPHGSGFLTPPEDLRFLFGARFDAKTLIAPLVKSGK